MNFKIYSTKKRSPTIPKNSGAVLPENGARFLFCPCPLVAARCNYPFREPRSSTLVFRLLLDGEALVEDFLHEGLGELLQLLDRHLDDFRDISELAHVVLRERNAALAQQVLHQLEGDFALPFGIHRILLSRYEFATKPS